MAGLHTLRCRACEARYTVKTLTLGRVPVCKSCGGALVLPALARLRCVACKIISKPRQVKLAAVIPCPKCAAAMAVVPAPKETQPVAAFTPAVTPPTKNAVAESQTIHASAETIAFAPGEHPPPAAPIPIHPPKAKPSKSKKKADDDLALAPEDAGGAGGLRKSTFGRYAIRREIARGGMGIVYRAYDPTLKRDVALKVLIAGEGATDETIRRFLREARSAGSLQHPNIVTVHEAGEENGQHYFTMDLISGADLNAVLADGKTSLRAILGYMLGVCRALVMAHSKGIIHRDLKPGNVMINELDTPLVMDFGLAKDMTSNSIQSMTGAVFGTPAYMSPEQAQGRVQDIDHRTDVYAIGVMLYEIATGEKPFDGETVFDTIEQVVHHEPLPPMKVRPRLDADLNTIILKCMEKDPDKRYPDMVALADDLDCYLDHQPIRARPLPKPILWWRRIRRNTPALVAAVAIPAVLLVGIGVYILFGGNSFLRNIEDAVKSNTPARSESAVKNLANEMQSGKLTTADEQAWAVRIARVALRGKSDAAAMTAMTILAPQKDASSIKPLLDTIASAEHPTPRRLAALGALDAIGLADYPHKEDATKTLIQVARKPQTPRDVCEGCLASVGKLSGKNGARELGKVATTVTLPGGVRVAAIRALGGRISLSSPHMKTLLQLQGDEDATVVRAAEAALLRARTKMSIFALYGIQNAAGKALSQAGKVTQINAQRQQQLLDLMNDDDGGRAKPKAKKPVDIILKKLDAPAADVRMAAAYDLGVVGNPEALPLLVGTLTDTDPGVRRSVTRAVLKIIGKHPQAPLLRKPIRAFLKHRDPLVRENAAVLLGGLADVEAVEDLVNALADETSNRAIRSMVKALAATGDTGGLVAIRNALDRTQGKTAITCIRAFVAFENAAVPHLIHALKTAKVKRRAAAARALKEITGEDFGTTPEAWQAWLEKQ